MLSASRFPAKASFLRVATKSDKWHVRSRIADIRVVGTPRAYTRGRCVGLMASRAFRRRVLYNIQHHVGSAPLIINFSPFVVKDTARALNNGRHFGSNHSAQSASHYIYNTQTGIKHLGQK